MGPTQVRMCGGLRLVLRYLDRAVATVATRHASQDAMLGDVAAAERLLKMLAWLGMDWILVWLCVCVSGKTPVGYPWLESWSYRS